jgi:phenylpropionate dioxygenase-like ring-hydroxylating dioxygenase large terminal subunit
MIELTEDLPFIALRKTWQPVALSSDLPAGRVTGYTLLERELVLARFTDGRLLAADVACPHKGARLSAGRICNGELMCPYHGWRFDSHGRCQSIPSLIDSNPDKLRLSHLRTYSVLERYGMVWVKLDPSGAHALPDVPEFENPAWTYRLGPPTRFAAGFRREIEN